MGIGFYTGVSGMTAYQEQLNVISNNIANVSTYGFKASRASFSDLLYSKMNANVGENQVGHGTRVVGTDLLYGQSGIDQTGYPLDFAIMGEGFFAVDNKGTTEYTRNGAFSLRMDGKRAYLITSDGANVLDKKGKAIAVDVDSAGAPDIEDVADRLGIYVFQNPYGLSSASGSRFLPGANTGEATELSKVKSSQRIEGEKSEVIPFALERSTVDLGNEMVGIIGAQRAFQLNARVVQTADQFDEVINNLR